MKRREVKGLGQKGRGDGFIAGDSHTHRGDSCSVSPSVHSTEALRHAGKETSLYKKLGGLCALQARGDEAGQLISVGVRWVQTLRERHRQRGRRNDLIPRNKTAGRPVDGLLAIQTRTGGQKSARPQRGTRPLTWFPDPEHLGGCSIGKRGLC